MVKHNKTISLDVDVIEELDRIENASGLINSLLKDYFYVGGGKIKEELKEQINELKEDIGKNKEQMGKLKLALKDLEDREKELKEAFNSIPSEVIEDFSKFDNMTEDILLGRYANIYRDKYSNLNSEQLLIAFRKFKEKE